MRRLYFVALIVLVSTPGVLVSQPVDPPWLLVARAERHMEASEIGLAIRVLREALTLSPDNPEASFLLGIAYASTGVPGDLAVADEYFRRALEHRARFVVPDDALSVRYARADVFRTQRNFARYEQELALIVSETPLPDDVIVPSGAGVQFAERGVDRMLVLYRVPENGGTRARGMLAELLVGLGRYDDAADLAAVALLQSLTTLVEAVLRRDPLYEFSTLEELITSAGRYEETRRYLATTTLFRDLYYLAAAFLGRGDRGQTPASAIWRRLAAIPNAGVWATRSAVQLRDPRLEPLLIEPR